MGLHHNLRPFETLAGAVVLNVVTNGEQLPPPAQQIVGLIADLGCEVRRFDFLAETRPQAPLPVWLIVLDPAAPFAAAKKSLEASCGRTLHLQGPKLSSEQLVELILMGAGAYLDDSDAPILSAARLLAFAQRQISGVWRVSTSSEITLGDLVLDPVSLTIRGPLGCQPMTETEIRLLRVLANSTVVSPEDLCQSVFERRDFCGRGRDLVYRHIANLRSKMRMAGGKEYLLTERAGYRVHLSE
jgi:hypothetical protein